MMRGYVMIERLVHAYESNGNATNRHNDEENKLVSYVCTPRGGPTLESVRVRFSSGGAAVLVPVLQPRRYAPKGLRRSASQARRGNRAGVKGPHDVHAEGRAENDDELCKETAAADTIGVSPPAAAAAPRTCITPPTNTFASLTS